MGDRLDDEILTRIITARVDRDIEYLLNALRDPKYRYLAAKYLGDLRAREAAQPLIRLLRAGERKTRSSACEALGKIGAREATPELIQFVMDEKELVPRTFGIMALGSLGDSRAVALLIDLLSDREVLIRQPAARALGMIGDPEAIGPLREAAAREKWFERGLHRKAIRQIRSRSVST